MSHLFETLSLTGTKPAILSLIAPHSDDYVPRSSLGTFPLPLKSLQQPRYTEMQYHELLAVCDAISLEVTKEMSELVEKETRLQSKSSLWYKYRAGRITSSSMKAVCHTDSTNPSQSLVKSICYPEEFAFTSKQTNWGQKQEKAAKELYLKINISNHDQLVVTDSGLVINPQWPYMGASPDGIIECKCCGKGVLEVKCPYSHREESVLSAALNDNKFCLKMDNGELHLSHEHAYYYQVQTQMFVCNVNYCDFCVCTFPLEEEESSPHIERITRDDEFWKDCLIKAKTFFTTCLLPELLGNWYTRPVLKSSNSDQNTTTSQSNENAANQSNIITASANIITASANVITASANVITASANVITASASQDMELYCYCHGPEKGSMIACDNSECKIEWFHNKCLKLKSIPRGKWYCPECRRLPQFIKRGKKQ